MTDGVASPPSRVMPFDQRQRYDVVATLATLATLTTAGRLSEIESPVALDAGGYFETPDGRPVLPIREILSPPWRTVTADCHPVGVTQGADGTVGATKSGLPGYVLGDATRLPLGDDRIDLVSCLDVLEHVPSGQRRSVVAELVRVSRGYIAISVPVADDGAAQRERELAGFIQEALGTDHRFLEEHDAFGLPTHDEMLTMLPAGTQSFGFGNLDRWFAIMLAKHYMLALPYAHDASSRLDAAYLGLGRDPDCHPPFYRRFYLTPARDDAPTEPIMRTIDAFGSATDREPPSTDAFLAWIFRMLFRSDHERFTQANTQVLKEHDQATALLRDVEASGVYKLYRMARALRPGDGRS